MPVSSPSGHITAACREIAGASKRPERGKSPDARRAPRSFHDSGEVERDRPAEDARGRVADDRGTDEKNRRLGHPQLARA
jgi:hypothetical protein